MAHRLRSSLALMRRELGSATRPEPAGKVRTIHSDPSDLDNWKESDQGPKRHVSLGLDAPNRRHNDGTRHSLEMGSRNVPGTSRWGRHGLHTSILAAIAGSDVFFNPASSIFLAGVGALMLPVIFFQPVWYVTLSHKTLINVSQPKKRLLSQAA
jgi:hypothetical protein